MQSPSTSQSHGKNEAPSRKRSLNEKGDDDSPRAKKREVDPLNQDERNDDSQAQRIFGPQTYADNIIESLFNEYKARKPKDPDPCYCKLLLLACELGNLDAVNILIKRDDVKLEFSVEKGNEKLTASDYAIKNQNYDCLYALLKAEAPLPSDYINKDKKPEIEPKVLEKIDQIIREPLKLHQLIKSGDFSGVKKFVEDNPKYRFAYDDKNQCALRAALVEKKIPIYSFLRSKHYATGFDVHEYWKVFRGLDEKINSKIWVENKKYFKKDFKDHVIDLFYKSKNGFGTKEQFVNQKIDYFDTLDGIDEISPILQIAACHEDTNIVFDFNRDHVKDMDPCCNETTHGVTHSTGTILIGASIAKKRKKCDVLATIAHELTHWAMQVVYDNARLPYFSGVDDRKNKIEDIAKIYNSEEFKSKSHVISDVYKIYKPEKYVKELIVRVPHLLALRYEQIEEGRKQLQNNFKELFDFYNNFVLSDVRNYLELLVPKEKIMNFNNELLVFAKFRQRNDLSIENLQTIDISKKVFIESKLPKLVLQNIIKQLLRGTKDIDSKHIFIDVEQFDTHFEALRAAAGLKVNPTIFIINSKETIEIKNKEEWQKFLKENFKIIFISNCKNVHFQEQFQSKIAVNFGWNHLNDSAKSRIRNSKVKFQNNQVIFKEIVKNEMLFNETPLESLWDPSAIELHSSNDSLPRVFIKRFYNFPQKYASELKINDIVDDDELCDALPKLKVVLIADSAGMGKSTSAIKLARNLKSKNPLQWVVFIDLKQHTELYERNSQLQEQTIDSDFISQMFIKQNSKFIKFEQQIFRSSYEIQEIIFIIDGFDEISPSYNKFVIRLLKTITSSGNLLLVTTRPHLAQDLEQKLGTKAINLRPFDEKDQIEFLTKHWRDDSNNNEIRSVEELIQKFNQISYNFLATPIHIFMLAEVFAESDLTNIDRTSLNFFSFYQKFFNIKIRIWEEKGPLYKKDNEALHQTFPATNLKQIFYRLAIEHIFSPEEAENLKIPKVPENVIDETIARVGIVAFGSKGSAQFTHQTYAEFFVADLIANQVFKKDPSLKFVKLFADIIFRIENFEQIWKFLNDKREIMKDFIETEALEKHFEEIVKQIDDWREIEDYDSEGSSIWNMPSYLELISFILETLNFEIDLKKRFLIFFWQHFGDRFEYFSIIWTCAKNITDQPQEFLKKLLFTKVRGFDFMTKALQNEWKNKAVESKRASKIAIEFAENSLNEEDFVKLFFYEEERNESIEHMINFDEDYFFEFWALAEKKLGQKNLKKLALSEDDDGQTILQVIARINREALKWLQILRNPSNPLLTLEEFDKHLTARDDLEDLNFLELFIENTVNLEEFKSIWKFIEENSSLETHKKILLNKDQDGKTLIEFSFDNKDKSMIDFIFDITDSVLQKTEGKTFTDWLRDHERLVYVIFNLVVLADELFDKCSSKFDAEEFRSLLLTKSSQNNFNVFHCFVDTKNSRSIELWNRIVEKIDDLEQIKVLLFDSDDYGGNVFCFAAKNNNPFLIELLEWCKTTFDHDFMTKIFTEQDGKTLMLIVAEKGDENLNLKCLEFVSNNFELQEQRKMLQKKNKFGEFPIERSFENENREVTEILAEFYEKLFKKEELKEIIFGEINRYRSQEERREYRRKKFTLENRWKNKSGL